MKFNLRSKCVCVCVCEREREREREQERERAPERGRERVGMWGDRVGIEGREGEILLNTVLRNLNKAILCDWLIIKD